MHIVKLVRRNDVELGERVILQIALQGLKGQVMRNLRIRCTEVWCCRRSAVCRRKKELPIVLWSEVVLMGAVIRVGVVSRRTAKTRERDGPLIPWSNDRGQTVWPRVIDCSRVGYQVDVLLI